MYPRPLHLLTAFANILYGAIFAREVRKDVMKGNLIILFPLMIPLKMISAAFSAEIINGIGN